MIGSLYQDPHNSYSGSINDDNQQPEVKEKKPSSPDFPKRSLREKISEKISFLRHKTNEIGLSFFMV